MTEEDKSERKDNPKWSLFYWLGLAVIFVGIGAWCINDGWFRENYEWKTFSQVLTPVVFATVLWCIYRGVKEYRWVKAKAEGGDAESASAGEPTSGDSGDEAGQGPPRDQAGGDGEPKAEA